MPHRSAREPAGRTASRTPVGGHQRSARSFFQRQGKDRFRAPRRFGRGAAPPGGRETANLEEVRKERILNRRLVLLNVALLALAGALVWTLRTNWLAAKARERAVLQRKVAAKTVLAPPPLPTVKTVAPAEYIDVAGKMLFSKDRNPAVVVEPPKPPPEPVMPALPSYHGQMAIGEPVIFLSASAAAPQRIYHAGEQVGDFKLVSFDENRVAFEWKGKNVERKLEELRPKETVVQAGVQAGAQATAPAASVPPAAATPVRPVASLDHPSAAVAPASATPAPAKAVMSLNTPSPNAANNGSTGDASGDSVFGPLSPSGDRPCLPTDNSPVGTVHSGFMKVQSVGIFGASCSWTE